MQPSHPSEFIMTTNSYINAGSLNLCDSNWEPNSCSSQIQNLLHPQRRIRLRCHCLITNQKDDFLLFTVPSSWVKITFESINMRSYIDHVGRSLCKCPYTISTRSQSVFNCMFLKERKRSSWIILFEKLLRNRQNLVALNWQ